MHSTDDIVEKVRDATSIVDIISEHVRLRKRGRGYLGLCPFHNEKTPSFNVLEDKGIFKCFGCAEAGDIYSFLMKAEGLTFPEALEKLAARAGIQYDRSTRKDDAHQDKNEPIYTACREFAAYCYRALRSNAPHAEQYLADRGFGEQALKTFGVGYAPEGAESFLHTLQEKNATLPPYEHAGILAKNDRGEYYDRFRDRVIFPIMNPTGRIIGFGGRVLPGNMAPAKYINSPETSIYHKSQVLYGLFQAKDAIRKKDYALLVEGYADVVALSQAGFTNCIAASGTSLTTEQLNLLRRYSQNIVLLFDSDLAGKNAALRGIELALTAGFDVNCLVLPQGEDPDSFIKANGAEAFERQLDARVSFIEAKAQLLREQGLFESPEGAARAVRSLVETIAKVPDGIKQEFFVRRVAEKFKLQETTLLAELQKLTKRDRRAEVKKQIAQEFAPKQFLESNSSPTYHATPPSQAERVLLRAFLDDTHAAYQAMIELDFDYALIENHYTDTVIAHCISHLKDTNSNPSPAAIIEIYRDDDEIVTLITDTLTEKHQLSGEWTGFGAEDTAQQISRTAHHAAVQIVSNSISKELKTLQSEFTASGKEDTLRKIQEHTQKLHDLRRSLV